MSLVPEPPVVSPRTLGEAYDYLSEGRWQPIAGGTDLMVQLASGAWEAARLDGALRPDGSPLPDGMLDLWRLDELRGITLVEGALALGALTTYTELRRSELVRRELPVLVEAAGTVGAAQIQNRGTIGGNIVNASPAGDLLPVLLATDAIVEVGGARGMRHVPASDFWIAYRRTALAADELVLRVLLPLTAGRRVRYRKVGTRHAQAISKVVMALAHRDDGAMWRDVRICLGSVAPVPVRAPLAEAVLEGTRPDRGTADRACAVLEGEVRPIDDVRSTAAYRRAVSGRVLHRLLREEVGW